MVRVTIEIDEVKSSVEGASPFLEDVAQLIKQALMGAGYDPDGVSEVLAGGEQKESDDNGTHNEGTAGSTEGSSKS